ncbi:hypothetical protein PFISCL1PPCAC_17621, partial [Pristionchus fissidentatus]
AHIREMQRVSSDSLRYGIPFKFALNVQSHRILYPRYSSRDLGEGFPQPRCFRKLEENRTNVESVEYQSRQIYSVFVNIGVALFVKY